MKEKKDPRRVYDHSSRRRSVNQDMNKEGKPKSDLGAK